MNNMILINNESPGTIYVRGLLIDGGDLCALRAGYRYTRGRKFFCVFKIGSSIQLELDM